MKGTVKYKVLETVISLSKTSEPDGKEAGWHTQENGANVPPSTRRVLREIQDSLNG